MYVCVQELSQLAAANISLRKLAAAEVRRHRSRARNELHDGFSSDDDACINDDDSIENDDDDKDEVGENVSLRLGRPYDLHNRRSGVTQATQQEYTNIKDLPSQENKNTMGNEFRNFCPLIHGLLSEGNFNLWGDLVQYLVGEVRLAHGSSSSNCSVSSTATNRVHKRSLSLRKKLKRLSIRLSNLLQQIHRPYAEVVKFPMDCKCLRMCICVLYVCILPLFLLLQHKTVQTKVNIDVCIHTLKTNKIII
jgi:hypothetical protein